LICEAGHVEERELVFYVSGVCGNLNAMSRMEPIRHWKLPGCHLRNDAFSLQLYFFVTHRTMIGASGHVDGKNVQIPPTKPHRLTLQRMCGQHDAAYVLVRSAAVAWWRPLAWGMAVRGFVEQFADGVFDAATVSILEDAFEDAWRRVQTSNAPYGSEEYALAGRTILARHIIAAAKEGERDPRWLADSALLYLSQQKVSRTPPDVLP
jgi:hypothetical protein